ncbi:MAG: hypothetical protein RLZZ89_1263, partial [Cyanobacteriota bacterium]
MILDSSKPFFGTIKRMLIKIPFRSLLLVTIIAISLAGCAGLTGNSIENEAGQPFNADQLQAQEDLPKFSAERPKDGMPDGWHFYRIAPYKKNTLYRLENYQGRTVLAANSKTSASGLAVKLRPRSAQNLWLQWEWKAIGVIPQADNADSQHDDAPLR